MPPLSLVPGFDPFSASAALVVFLGLVLLAAGRALLLEEEQSPFSASAL